MSDRRRVSQAQRKTWADPIDVDRETNCGTCHLRDRCPDPRKSRGFACSLWIQKDGDPSSRDFVDYMRDLVRRESVVPDAYAIDDRAVPQAANSYEWNCGKGFLEFTPRPYPKQLELSLKLYGDMCSFCRGPWYDDIPFDCDIHDIPRKVRLRRFGVCEHCGRSKLDGILEGREIDYQTLVSMLGQRCVTGDTLVETPDGPRRIDELVGDVTASGWSSVRPFSCVMEDGRVVRVGLAWTGTTTELVTIRTRGGRTLTGTPHHRLRVEGRWQALEHCREGQHLYGLAANTSGVMYWVSDAVESVERRTLPEPVVVYDLRVPEYDAYVANGLHSHNSGKSTGMSLISSYQLHWLLKIKNPSAFYGLKSGTVLYNTIVGITYGGAKTNVFDPLLAAIDESPWFKCIAENEPIRMEDGSSKPIQDVQTGDRVRTLEGSEEVTNVFDNGVREIVELELDDGTVLRATEDHLVRVQLPSGLLIWKTIKDLDEEDMVVIEYDMPEARRETPPVYGDEEGRSANR